jgi:hypothetical protein
VNPLAQSRVHELKTELLAEANHLLERLASSDGSTRGATHYRFQSYCQACWHSLGKRNFFPSLIMGSVDFFNDTMTHGVIKTRTTVGSKWQVPFNAL